MFSNNNFHSIGGSLNLDLTCCDVIRGADASPRVVMTPLARCWLLPPRPHCFCLFSKTLSPSCKQRANLSPSWRCADVFFGHDFFIQEPRMKRTEYGTYYYLSRSSVQCRSVLFDGGDESRASSQVTCQRSSPRPPQLTFVTPVDSRGCRNH